MADNITVTQGSGVTIRTDDVGGVQYPVTKIALGADGAFDTLVDSGQQTMANSVPVVLASDHTDVKITLDGEAVVLGAGAAAIGTVSITAVVPGTSATSLGKAEDAAHSSGDTGVQLLAVRQSSPANLSDTNGDYEPLQVSAGRLWVSAVLDTAIPAGGNTIGGVNIIAALPAGTNAIGKLAANSGVDIGDVDITSQIPGTGATNLGKAEDGIHGSGDTGVMALAVRKDTAAGIAADGDYHVLEVDANGRLHVINSAGVAGDVADDGSDSGSPVKIGGKVVSNDGTDPGKVSTEGDRFHFIGDTNRRVYVNTMHPQAWMVNENHSSAQTNNTLKSAPGAGKALVITDVIISNGATAGTVKIVEDESGTPADLMGPYYLAVNGGAVINLESPKRLTANKSLGFTSATVTTHTITISGYTQDD